MRYHCVACDSICRHSEQYRDWGVRHFVECPDCLFGICWDVSEE